MNRLRFAVAATVTSLLSIAIGLAAVEWSCGYLLRHQIHPKWQLESTHLSSQSGLLHGLFPASPPVPAGFHHQVPDPDPSLLSPYRLEQGMSGRPRGYPFVTIVKSGRITRYTHSGRLINDTYAHIDEFGRRVTKIDPASRPQEYLLFTGCSFTFGMGVNDDGTLPFFAGKLGQGRYHPYNYGIPGVSPAENWWILSHIRKGQELPEKTGWVVYTFIDDHVRRLIGSMSVIGNWGGANLGHFYESATGDLLTDGTFKEAQPRKVALYRLLDSLNLVRFFSIDIPRRIDDSDLEFFARVVEKMREVSLHRLNARGFVVLIWPGSSLAYRLIPLLEKHGISYIDYSSWDLDALTDGHSHLPLEFHPASASYELIARSLLRNLQKLDNSTSSH